MDDAEWLAQHFDAHRAHLRAVAFRLLGSTTEADDALQEAWLRVSRAGTDGVENLGGWLTTVVSRACLDMLEARHARREDPLDLHAPGTGGPAPEHEALLADAVGPALWVVLETLEPAERLAFVLHDVFGVPLDEIAAIVGRSPVAARQLASRARCRVQGTAATPPPITRASAPSWRRSWRRRAAAISARCWPCSIPTWCCGPTALSRRDGARSCPPRCGARRPWPRPSLGGRKACNPL